jgi:hypothetical protein
MKLGKSDHELIFKGFFLIDCVVRKSTSLYFLLQQNYDSETDTPPKATIRTRVASCFDRPDPDNVWGYASLGGMHYLRAGVSLKPKEQFVGVSMNDHVYVLGGGDDEFEDDLKTERNSAGERIGKRGAPMKSRTIDGWLWVTGTSRLVGRRLGRNQWEWHASIPIRSLMEDGGFNDIDGFNGTDIYAAGGHGDIWHYDGATWTQCPFPSNMTLEAICCAGNGEVYIGAESGTVFKGRGNKWKMISRGSMALPFKDMVWHNNQVWCTSDYGLWVIDKNDKVVEADVPSEVAACSGHLSVGDGVMLLAGIGGAAMHDGKSWKMIVDYSNLD